jgi:aspartate/methionine/tyrosine aminotransferase
MSRTPPSRRSPLRIDDPRVSERVQSLPESVIRQMTRVAELHGAVNLAQEFPDFDPPPELVRAAKQAIDSGANQYSVTWGTAELREAISLKARRFNRIDSNPEKNVVVTCGATEAMMAAMLSVVNPGDEVIVFEPFYENYGPDVTVSGATARHVPLAWPDRSLPAERLKGAFNSRTKAIIVNIPNNPTGKVFSREELRLIADLCVEHDVVAVTDEIYEHMVDDGRRHISLAALGDITERTITIDGLSKTYSATGWRVGWHLLPRPWPRRCAAPTIFSPSARRTSSKWRRSLPWRFRRGTTQIWPALTWQSVTGSSAAHSSWVPVCPAAGYVLRHDRLL